MWPGAAINNLLPSQKDHAMTGYTGHIKTLSATNSALRQVVYTGHHLQLVLMALKPGEEMGAQTHATHDQFFRVQKGHGTIVIDGASHKVKAGDAVIVPAQASHILTNTGKKRLRLYALESPADHPEGLSENH
jgi:mannose-6-phosphate isomerase-like protein (cupin superfamily)